MRRRNFSRTSWFKASVITLLISCTGACVADDWVGPFEYTKFSGGFPAGDTKSDEPILLGLALKSKDKISLFDLTQRRNVSVKDISLREGDEWVLAKVSKFYKGAFFINGDEEHHTKTFMLFKPDDADSLKWQKASDGAIPEDSVTFLDPDVYICRAQWVEGFVPGTLNKGEKVCEFGYAAGVVRSYVYEVLVRSDKR